MTPDAPREGRSSDSRDSSKLVAVALLIGMFAYAVVSAVRSGRDAWQQML